MLLSDPVVFKRDANNDLLFPLALASGLEAAAIGARTRILMCRGEWFLDLDAGVPYLPTADGVVGEADALLGRPFDPVKTRTALIRELMSVPSALDVPTFKMSFDAPTRVLSITWVLRTIFGDTAPDTLRRTV